MSTIVTRAGKGSPLTNAEVDNNFTNLNTDKYQEGSAIGAVTPAAGTFTTLDVTTSINASGSNANVNLNLEAKGAASVRITPQSANAVGLVLAAPSSSTSNAGRLFFESSAGISAIANIGGNQLSFRTAATIGSSSGSEQARVSHTASAVNYVQVTGAATGAGNYTTISSQGSDAAVNLRLSAKGTGTLDAQVNSTTRWKINSDGSVDSGISASGGISFKASATGSQVNYLQSAGGVAGSAPILSTQGSDTNIDLTLTPKGTGTVVANGPFTATGQTSLGGAAGANNFRVLDTAGSVNYWNVRGGDGSTTSPRFSTDGTGTNIAGQFVTKGTGAFQFATNNGTEQLRVTHTSSAVNYVQVTGAATGNRVGISAQGSDTNVDMMLTPKGSGVVKAFGGLYINEAGASVAGQRLQISTSSAGAVINQSDNSPISLKVFNANALDLPYSTASAVNYAQIYNSATGNALWYRAAGSDTNISQVFQSKGTGAIDLAAGSSGVNISNGGTVTAITRAASGSTYTGVPSIAISAPTTAGGVQATATVTQLGVHAATVVAGGTGYTNGDVLTIVGGTPSAVTPKLTVTGVSGGVITSVSVDFLTYTAIPTSPVSVTGGTGSGATFNLTYFVPSGVFTITNAGSGYVEQPTVSFSGGGGSGAAAYATVGGTSVLRSLGALQTFNSSSGPAFGVGDRGPLTQVDYLIARGGAGSVLLQAGGSSSNIGVIYQTNGTSGHNFTTSGSQTSQLQVAHTASAVNYVQVTGAATGSAVSIQGQGSDAAVGLNFVTKGSSNIGFYTNGASSGLQFIVLHAASVANRLTVSGAATGASPVLASNGSDTNIDLTLTPKGTGNVRFGTYTASMALTVQGYIEIKDSGGTVRKLAVVA